MIEPWLYPVLTAVALAFSTFQLVVAAFHPLSSLVTRSLHVGFLLALVAVLFMASLLIAVFARVIVSQSGVPSSGSGVASAGDTGGIGVEGHRRLLQRRAAGFLVVEAELDESPAERRASNGARPDCGVTASDATARDAGACRREAKTSRSLRREICTRITMLMSVVMTPKR